MKLTEVIESDEFDNQEKTLDHLYRIQQARTYEFEIFFGQMANKYPELKWMTNSSSGWRSRLHATVASSPLTIEERKILSHQEQIKYARKRERLIAAKKAYEYAGGKYDN